MTSSTTPLPAGGSTGTPASTTAGSRPKNRNSTGASAKYSTPIPHMTAHPHPNATHPAWAKRMHRVLKSLNQELVDYKGFTRYRDQAVQWLSQFDDGK